MSPAVTPLAGAAPERGEEPRTSAVSLLLAVLLVVVPTGAAFAASSLPVPTPTATSPTGPTSPTAPGAQPQEPVLPVPPTQPVDPSAPVTDLAAACPSGVLGWITTPLSGADGCLAATLGTSVSWLFQYSVTTVTSYVAFNPLRGSYWEVYLWHLALLSVVAVVAAVLQWLVSLVADGALEGMRSAGRSFVLLALGLPMAFAVPFFVLLVDAGILAVTGAFAGVFAGRVAELAGQLSAALLIGQTPGALLASVLLTAFLVPLLLVMVFAFVLRQIAVYAVPVYGQFGLLPAIVGDGGDALRTYFRIMAGTLLFPLQFVDLLVIGVSFLDFTAFDEGFVSLLYIIGVILFALVGGSFLSLVFGVHAGSAAYAGARRAAAGRRLGGGRQRFRRWGAASAAGSGPVRGRGARVEETRLGALALARWEDRRAVRERRAAERDASRTPASPLYWTSRPPVVGSPTGGAGAGAGAGGDAEGGAPRTYGDRARERRGRRVGGSSAPGVRRGRGAS